MDNAPSAPPIPDSSGLNQPPYPVGYPPMYQPPHPDSSLSGLPPQPYQPMYPTIPQMNMDDPGLNYTPNEPPPAYQSPTIIPVRPAPGVPPTQITHPIPPHGNYNLCNDTPLPSNLTLAWSGCEGVKIFFIQPEPELHVVSPEFTPEMTPKIDFYSLTTGSRRGKDIVAAIDIKKAWRLKLTNDSCYLVKSKYGDLAFLDHSTDPSTERVTVLRLSGVKNQDEVKRFEKFVIQHAKVYKEDPDTVTKLTTGVSSIYNTVTKTVNEKVKGIAPDTHKSTKSIRKGAGGIVKFGGNLLTKGAQLAANQLSGPESEQNAPPDVFLEEHVNILKALHRLKKAEEAGEVTSVPYCTQ